MAPAGVGFTGMFEAVGPRPDLFGLASDSLRIEDVDGDVRLVDESLFHGYDPDSSLDPVAVQLRLATENQTDFYAIAVNGMILSTISPYRTDRSSVSILAIVPPGSFRAGDNEVEVFGISGAPGSTTLIRYR